MDVRSRQRFFHCEYCALCVNWCASVLIVLLNLRFGALSVCASCAGLSLYLNIHLSDCVYCLRVRVHRFVAVLCVSASAAVSANFNRDVRRFNAFFRAKNMYNRYQHHKIYDIKSKIDKGKRELRRGSGNAKEGEEG